MKSKIIKYTIIIFSLFLLMMGLFLIKINNNPQGVMRALPYVCIGIGCGLFGYGMEYVLYEQTINEEPKLKKILDIEKREDERSEAIENKAKRKAFDMMTFVFGALMISFAIMEIDTVAIFLLIFAYLFIHGFEICYYIKIYKNVQIKNTRIE